jgi:hypothetical protein
VTPQALRIRVGDVVSTAGLVSAHGIGPWARDGDQLHSATALATTFDHGVSDDVDDVGADRYYAALARLGAAENPQGIAGRRATSQPRRAN